MKGFALRPVLKQRHKGTRKWPIAFELFVVAPVQYHEMPRFQGSQCNYMLNTSLMGHSHLAHMRIRYLFIANLHIIETR